MPSHHSMKCDAEVSVSNADKTLTLSPRFPISRKSRMKEIPFAFFARRPDARREPCRRPCRGEPAKRGRHLLLPIVPEKVIPLTSFKEGHVMKKNVSRSSEETLRYGIEYRKTLPKWLNESTSEKLMKVLASRFKKSICVETPPYYNVHSLLDGSLDIIAEPMLYGDVKPLGHLYPHLPVDMCVIVKRRRRVQQSIMQSFCADTWIATGLTLVLFAGALRVIGRRTVVFEVLDTFINGGFETRESDIRGNTVNLLLSVFGLVMVNAFTGRFMGFLAVLGEPPQIQTLEEVVREVSGVFAPDGLQRILYSVDKNDVIWKLLSRFRPYSKEPLLVADARQRLAVEGPGPAYVMARMDAEKFLEWPGMTDAWGYPLAHVVDECLFTPAYAVLWTRPRCSLQRRLDALMQAAVEGGLVKKLYRWVLMQRV
ncbi:Protein of unknown function [Gryllus bimaculatus]|nr:Protein of unknown function [Gryllus bimaculatus]